MFTYWDTYFAWDTDKNHTVLWDDFRVEGKLWQLRYSKESDSWNYDIGFSIDNSLIPVDLLPDTISVPDVRLSWHVSWELHYTVERLDYVLSLYERANTSIYWWVWISKYRFTTAGEISIEGTHDSDEYQESVDFSWKTRKPLYNPAIIWEFNYWKDIGSGDEATLLLAARYEMGNIHASFLAWYTHHFNSKLSLHMSAGGDYRDYDSFFESFDWFDEWFQPKAAIWFLWKNWNKEFSWKCKTNWKCKTSLNIRF